MEENKKICFWNDNDGLSITDTISLLVCSTFLFLLTCTFFYLLLANEPNTERLRLIKEFLELFTMPLSIILSGYFGSSIVNKIKKRTKAEG